MVQNRSLHHTYFIPVVLYVLLILDGFLINAFPGQFVSEEYILVPHLALFGFVLFSYYFPKQPMQLYAVLFGLLFDSYYSGILGVYAVAFAVIVYFVKKMQRFWRKMFLYWRCCLSCDRHGGFIRFWLLQFDGYHAA
jgi:rod shape-determining protein MreD